MKNKIVNIIVFILAFYSSVICQTNHLTGIVIDSTKMEPLIGAIIHLRGHNYFAKTDVNGEYNFQNLPTGNYKFVCQYFGYQIYIDSISISDTSTQIIKNIELLAEYYPPAVYKDTIVSGYYNRSFEYSGIVPCGKEDDWWYIEANDSLIQLHREISSKVKNKSNTSSYGLAEVFITAVGKIQTNDFYLYFKRAFIVEEVLDIKLSTRNECGYR